MPNLLDDDARFAERRLLRVVALQLETLALVLDVVRGDGRVMRDLLYDELCAPAAFSIRPVSVEQLAQNGIKRLLFGTQFFIARGVLPFQRALERKALLHSRGKGERGTLAGGASDRTRAGYATYDEPFQNSQRSVLFRLAISDLGE